MIPAAIASPFLGGLADRYSRKLVMIAADGVRAALMVAAALTIWQGWSAYVVYAIVGLSTVTGTAFRPAQAALLPHLVRNAAELTAANVVSTTLESVGAFLGPALGGILLAFTSIETVFAVNALSFVASALLVCAVRGGSTPAPDEAQQHDHSSEGGVTAGFRALAGNHDLLVLSGLYCGQTLVAGALGVLVIVSALELLHVEAAGVEYLNAAIGVGGLIGGFVALVLATRGRLAADFGTGLAVFGLPLILIGVTSSVPVALVALALVGLGNSIVDINALTIMQRAVPDAVLARADPLRPAAAMPRSRGGQGTPIDRPQNRRARPPGAPARHRPSTRRAAHGNGDRHDRRDAARPRARRVRCGRHRARADTGDGRTGDRSADQLVRSEHYQALSAVSEAAAPHARRC